MFNIKYLRENPDLVKENMKKKFQEDRIKLVDDALANDEIWRNAKKKIDALRCERNKLSKIINETKKAGGDVASVLAKAKVIPAQIKELEEKQIDLVKENEKILSKIPNMMHDSVPLGKSDEDNVEIKKWGKIREFDFDVKNHVELLEELGLANFEKASDLSGNGFYVLQGELALLNQALIRFAIEFMQKKQYTYIEPPLMIKKEILDAAMDTAGFEETIYSVKDKDLHLIGTSEHAILGLHSEEAIPENKLPKKYFAYSMCFRQEIGSHGINEKGLWRTHQFNKVEQFIFCKPENSCKYYDELLQNTEELFQALELPYRHIECCSGDLATWKAKSSDIEVYRPTTKEYGEVTSLTNATDYQARGLNTKVIYKNGDREVLHTLNNTAIATSRVLVAILENYQNKDGSVTIPKVLLPYMLGVKELRKK